MFRTSKCSALRRLVHAVLWHFFYAAKQLTPNYISVKVNSNNCQCLMLSTRLYI